MRIVIKTELKKAFHTKSFFIVEMIGLILIVFQTIWVIRTLYLPNDLRYSYIIGLDYMDEKYGEWYEMGILQGWLGCEIYSPYNQLFFLVFPLIAAIPYGISFFDEWRTGYSGQVICRCGRKKYIISKFIAVFVSGGIAVAAPLFLSLLFSACYIPAVGTDILSLQSVVAETDMWTFLYYEYPVVYALCYSLLDLVLGGIFACIALAFSKWFTNRFAVIVFPMLSYLTLYLGIANLAPQLNRWNISLYINPAQIIGENSFPVCMGLVFGFIICLFLIFYIFNRKRDVLNRA